MSKRLWTLLHAGDWACSQGDSDALARVSREIARGLPDPGLADAAEAIATLAGRDPTGATLAWGDLSGFLRRYPWPEMLDSARA